MKQDEKEKSGFAPDPQTLHTTDPQEHMKGPLSTTLHEIGENVEEKGGETPDTPDTGQKMDGEKQ